MRHLFTVIVLFTCALVSAQETTGSVVGVISDKEMNNGPLPFANVQIKGTSKGTTTDMDGLYEISAVEPGTYTIVISFIGYQTLEVPNIKVEAGKVTELNTGIGAGSVSLDEVVVTTTVRRDSETALLLDQKKAIEIKESIGAEELSRKGVSNVEQGLTKVTGISKQESRGVIVRGLDDRYNYLTVNGLPFITADPDKKIVPLDRFSTDLVRNVNIYKTFNQDLYGDFAGASIDIITKDIPTKSTTTIKVGFSGNSQTSFKDFKLDEESAVENLGIQGNNRELPSAYDKNLVELGYRSSSLESKDLFDTDFNYENQTAFLGSSLEVNHGGKVILDENTGKNLGYYISFGTENSYYTIPEAIESSLNTQGGFNSNYTDIENYYLTTAKSSLISLVYKKPNAYSFKLNNILIQNTENALEEKFGYNSEANDEFFFRSSRYRQTLINHTQFLGEFYLGADNRSEVKFGTSYGIGRYEEPDRKIVRAQGSGEDTRMYTANNGNPFRFWADLDISDVSAFAEYKYNFGSKNEDGDYNNRIIIGGDLDVLQYDYFNRAIRLDANRSVGGLYFDLNDVDSFINRGFDQGYFYYEDASDASKFAEISQNTFAGYFAYNFVLNKWDFTVGVRGELSDRTINYRLFNTPVNDGFLQEKNDPFNVLPNLNIKYSLNDKSNLRLAASMTSTRPRVREILPIRYDGGNFNLVTGNRELENSTNYNIDLKYEYFFGGSGLFSATAFGKYIDNPIETVLTPVAGGSSIGYANTKEAQIFGLELEFISGLDLIFDNESLEDFTLGFNGSIMYSEAKIDKDDPKQNILTNDKRKLQGASPYLLNADLSYDKDITANWKSLFTVAYNVYGERIYALGGTNLDDTYEKPFNQLDFIWKNEFSDKLSIGFAVKNILNDKFKVVQTPTAVENASEISILEYERGVDFSLSIGYTF